jgi:hypothetical protein
MFISTFCSPSFPSSAVGLGCHTLDQTFFLSSACLSASSCHSSWLRC